MIAEYKESDPYKKRALLKILLQYPSSFDEEQYPTARSLALARQYESIFDSLPKGKIYPDFFYRDSAIHAKIEDTKSLEVVFPPKIGDTLMLVPALLVLKKILTTLYGNQISLRVKTKQFQFLEDIDGITFLPVTANSFDGVPVFDLTGKPPPNVQRDTELFWLDPSRDVPLVPNMADRNRSAPELTTQAIEILFGFKIGDKQYFNFFPYPQLNQEQAQRVADFQSIFPNGYFALSNTATIGPRRWPDDQYTQMIMQLQSQYPEIGLLYFADPLCCDTQTRLMLEKLNGRDSLCLRTVKDANLKFVTALIAGAKAGLFTDSGLGHISSLFIPTLRCFSCANPRFWCFPRNPNDHTLQTQFVNGLIKTGNPLDTYPHKLQIQAFDYPIQGRKEKYNGLFELTPEVVLSAFHHLI